MKRDTRELNRNSWNIKINNIEYDVHGCQEVAYAILRGLNKTERDKIWLNSISKDEWSRCFTNLWTIKQKE